MASGLTRLGPGDALAPWAQCRRRVGAVGIVGVGSMACAAHSGVIEFSIDQQPYVQGYMVVEGLWLQLTNGEDMGGGQPVRTSPVHGGQDQHRSDPA